MQHPNSSCRTVVKPSICRKTTENHCFVHPCYVPYGSVSLTDHVDFVSRCPKPRKPSNRETRTFLKSSKTPKWSIRVSKRGPKGVRKGVQKVPGFRVPTCLKQWEIGSKTRPEMGPKRGQKKGPKKGSKTVVLTVPVEPVGLYGEARQGWCQYPVPGTGTHHPIPGYPPTLTPYLADATALPHTVSQGPQVSHQASSGLNPQGGTRVLGHCLGHHCLGPHGTVNKDTVFCYGSVT